MLIALLLRLISYKSMTTMLAILTALGMVSTPSIETPINVIDPENVQLTFVAWADPQISNYMPERLGTFEAACEDVMNSSTKIDAFLMAGDIAENGFTSEYNYIAERVVKFNDIFDHHIYCYGNHDIRMKAYSIQKNRLMDFYNSISQNFKHEGTLYYSYEVNGYKFVVMNSEKTVFEEGYYSPTQLAWLDSEIASTQGTGKPVFVMNHQPLQDTHGLPGTWGSPEIFRGGSMGDQNDEVRAIFEKYNNVIFLSGHLHTGFGQYTYEDYGSFKSINLPGLCTNNADGYEEDGQGYVFEVYEDRIVARARVFSTGEYMPTYDITIDLTSMK